MLLLYLDSNLLIFIICKLLYLTRHKNVDQNISFILIIKSTRLHKKTFTKEDTTKGLNISIRNYFLLSLDQDNKCAELAYVHHKLLFVVLISQLCKNPVPST